jgi:hypothetical protein
MIRNTHLSSGDELIVDTVVKGGSVTEKIMPRGLEDGVLIVALAVVM